MCDDTAMLYGSPLWKPFALRIGFHNTIVEILHELEYLYSVVDAFTRRLLPNYRVDFDNVVHMIESGDVRSVAV